MSANILRVENCSDYIPVDTLPYYLEYRIFYSLYSINQFNAELCFFIFTYGFNMMQEGY